MVQREEEIKLQWSDVEKENRSTKSKEERSSTTAKNSNMLYTTSESTHTNTSPAKGK